MHNAKAIAAYKHIIAKVRRLPADLRTLGLLKTVVKQQFLTKIKPHRSGVDARSVAKATSVLDRVLIDVDLEGMVNVWDYLYKRQEQAWIPQFSRMKYSAFREIWPHVHLMEEVAPNLKQLREYQRHLSKDLNEEFSVLKFMGINLTEPGLQMLPRKPSPHAEDLTQLLRKVSQFHQFVATNRLKLTHLKIQPLEVVYPTNKYAQPVHVSVRDRLLKKKVNYMKDLCKLYKPMQKGDLEHLINVATTADVATPDVEINAAYFRYMERKCRSELEHKNPAMLQLRSKKLVPNENNIRKILRLYVMKQFYIENGSYQMSWMQNFYEDPTVVSRNRNNA
jgi:hypothetical protein